MNQHGLSRQIPLPVMRAVRQACYFGCVLCGSLPYQYEHFAPSFADATRHDPTGIALLCPMHHQERTSGRLAASEIMRARLRPHNRNHEGVWRPFLGSGPLTLILGSNRIEGPAVGLSVNGYPIFGARAPLNGGDPWLFTGNLSDSQGRGLLSFEDDELKIAKGLWDVELTGRELIVRQGPGNIVALVELDPERRVLSLRRLSMALGDAGSIVIDEQDLILSMVGGRLTFAECILRGDEPSLAVVQVGPPPSVEGPFRTIMINDPGLGDPLAWSAA